MWQNKMRQLLISRKVVMGVFLLCPSVAVVEMMGYAGFDFVILDTEHSSYSLETLENMVRAAESSGLATMARVYPDRYLVARVLDIGVNGVLISHCNSKKQAEEMVSMVRVPPMGIRDPMPTSRPSMYNLIKNPEYVNRTNQAVICIPILTKEALDNAEEILNVPGIDLVNVGPDRISSSLGVGLDHPAVADAEKRVRKAAREGRVIDMQLCATPQSVEKHLKEDPDLRVFWIGPDTGHITEYFVNLVKRSKEVVAKFI